ncbi:MAG: signal recognition particle-docking protein FtsY [Candidatus Brocadiae bacterium]|nr:signal recognition particle-docking protein FtsY [Candidatus Brocadiia bacterium]
MFWKKSLDKLKNALEKTRKILTTDVKDLFKIGRKIDDAFLEKLEETFIMADVGVSTTQKFLAKVKAAYKNKEITDQEEIREFLKKTLKEILVQKENSLNVSKDIPTVILVVGVNGCGKTTSIAKLAYYLSEQKKKVFLAASDTFRAAAIEQLDKWAQRVNVTLIRQASGSDPAAVAFDALEAAIARKADFLIVDTAGRLHNQKNLMEELSKIHRVIKKKLPEAPHEVLLVLDATTGQNALAQAKMFKEAVEVTGIFLSKLDGSAKGGVVLAIQNQIEIPVKFVGLGEQYEDIEPFQVERFIDALMN